MNLRNLFRRKPPIMTRPDACSTDELDDLFDQGGTLDEVAARIDPPTGIHHVGWTEHNQRGIRRPYDQTDTTREGSW